MTSLTHDVRAISYDVDHVYIDEIFYNSVRKFHMNFQTSCYFLALFKWVSHFSISNLMGTQELARVSEDIHISIDTQKSLNEKSFLR